SGLWGTSPVVNGDFAATNPRATGFGWTTSGSVGVEDQVAVLDESAQQFSGLSQTFTIPQVATALRFTIPQRFFVANGRMIPDAFEAALLDASTGASLADPIPGLSNTDAFFNLQTNG